MSQPIAETYVEIRPKLSQGFAGDLSSQIQRDVQKAAQIPVSGLASQTLSPRQVAAAQRHPEILQELRAVNTANAALVASNAAVAASEAQLTTQNDRVAKSHDNVAIHAHRSQIAGFTIRGTTLGMGAAAVIAAEGLHKLSDALKVSGDRATTLTGELRNAAAAALSGDFATAAQRLGEAAAIRFAPGAKAADTEAKASLAHEAANTAAIEAARNLLDLREKAAKAEGTVGTAAGATKMQLEQQLRIANLVYNALTKSQKRVAAGQFGLNPDLSNKVAVAPTDASRASDFALNAQRAGQTKSLANDRKLFADREDFLKKQIGFLENAGAHSQAAKDRLATLYGQLESVEGKIEGLQQEALRKRQERLGHQIALQESAVQLQAANARNDGQEIAALQAGAALDKRLSDNKLLDAEARAGYAVSAAQADKQIFEINQAAAAEAKRAAEEAARQAKQEREEAAARLKAAQQRRAQTLELSLQNQLARAQLTKGTKDDKAALEALANRYRELIKNSKGLEREQARAALIGVRGQLKDLKPDKPTGGATVAEFFAKAAQQSAEFGSNIAGRDGILSGQDARGRFADIALANRAPEKDITDAINQLGHYAKPALTAEEEQVRLLRKIANGVEKFGAPAGVADRAAINDAKAKAFHLGGV